MSDGVFWPEFEQWLLAHGIDDWRDVTEIAWRPPGVGVLNQGPLWMEVTSYRLRDGLRYLDRDGKAATETRCVPMLHLPAVEVVRYRDQAETG